MKASLSARTRQVAAVLLLALGLGCSHSSSREAKKNSTRCPESQSLVCLTEEECSLDRDRGCQVCQCGKPGAMEGDSRMPSGIPPDRRIGP